jgi:hypothetical protein
MSKFVLLLSLICSFSTFALDPKLDSFLREWFKNFDQTASKEAFLEHLSEEGFQFVFPEATLDSKEDFIKWYAEIESNIINPVHLIHEIRLIKETKDRLELVVSVDWSAENLEGKILGLKSKQYWTLLKRDDSYKIEKYVVVEVKPDSHRNQLSCTCYGGPGNYPYQCAPITKTCYGGPGMYPYSCSVCPK